MVWKLNDHPVIIYNSVKELLDLSKAGNIPKPRAQIISIGVEMIWKTQDFKTSLSELFECPAVQHTWQIFKYHSTDTHSV